MIKDKLKNIPQDVRRRFNGMTEEEQIAKIETYEKEIDADKHAKIEKFVNEQLAKGIKPRQIKKMVKKKFKVILI